MKRKNKSAMIITITVIVMIVLWIAFSYGVTKIMALPINLPFMKQEVLADSDISASEMITNTWYGTIIFEPKPVLEPEVIPEPEEPELTTKFDAFLDLDSLENYLNGHLDVMANGVENIFIDEVTVNNTPTGIKTYTGDDVYAIAHADGVLMAGKTLENGSRIKITFINKEADLDLDVVDNLTYWEEITVSAKDAEALLAVNASDYTWNYTYNCGRLSGLVKRHGDLIRKASNDGLTVGFTQDGDLIIGNPDDMYTGIEANQIIAMNGELLFDTANDDGTRSARTLIGQLKDGTIVLAVADMAGEGATITELVEAVNAYELDNAALLSGGNRTAIYWNGRVVNELEDEDGLKLPTTWIVKSDYITVEDEPVKETTETVVEENALAID